MATMNVSLPKTMIDFVDDMIADGTYASSSEVVGEALRLMQREKTAHLRREISAGLEDVAAGRFSSRSVADIAESVLNSSRRP